jgi:hypothetical protein
VPPEGGVDRDAERRARLLAIKLSALVRGRTAHAPETHAFALGAAAQAGDAAWVLLEDAGDDGRGLGAALAWAVRRHARSLDVITERGAGIMARRAAEFRLPITIWTPEGDALRVIGPEAPAPLLAPDPAHLDLVGDITAAGATPHVEHGVLTGEVRGLEVCRVVTAPDPASGDGATVVRLEVGVGAHDREAFGMIHGDRPTVEALAGVVAAVSAVRDVDAPTHPLSRLAPERYLRWRLEQDPGTLGFASVVPLEPPVPRLNLKDRSPCVALGRRDDGGAVIVVLSVGVDLDVVPYAADPRLAALASGVPGIVADDVGRGSADVTVVAPARDLVAVTRDLAGELRHSVTLVSSPLAS